MCGDSHSQLFLGVYLKRFRVGIKAQGNCKLTYTYVDAKCFLLFF